MTFGFVQDVPVDEAVYARVRELLPETPAGLIVHVVLKREGGLRSVDVWEDEAAWERFRLDHVEPALAQVLPTAGLDPAAPPPRRPASSSPRWSRSRSAEPRRRRTSRSRVRPSQAATGPDPPPRVRTEPRRAVPGAQGEWWLRESRSGSD